jgi:hypothetical protein
VDETLSPKIEDELEELSRADDAFLFEVAEEPETDEDAQISAVGKRCYCYCHCVR